MPNLYGLTRNHKLILSRVCTAIFSHQDTEEEKQDKLYIDLLNNNS